MALPRFRLRTLMIAVAAVGVAFEGMLSVIRLYGLPIVWGASALRCLGGPVIDHSRQVVNTIDNERIAHP